MTSITDFKKIFEEIAADKGLTFVYGNSERILSRQEGNLIYPLLWLEVPQIQLYRDGGLKARFNTAFLILDMPPTDIWEDQDTAQGSTLSITESVLQVLAAESGSTYEYDFADTTLDRKEKYSADDDWGWRAEIVITGIACEEPDCC